MSGWTSIRPWRPPRDDADEPILDDDDTQPDWDARAAERGGGRQQPGGRPGGNAGNSRVRPPVWPSAGGNRAPNRGGPNQNQGNVRGGSGRPPPDGGRRRGPPPPAGRRRPGTWMPPPDRDRETE